jgi:hypothetical protein
VTYQDQENSTLSRRINAIPLTFINQKPFEAGTARHRDHDGEPVYFTGREAGGGRAAACA